jgi:REP-associated tyrosine transposase
LGHSYSSNLIHLVFSTKERLPMIPAEREKALWDFLVGIGKNEKMPVYAVGGIANHIHLLYALPSTITLAKSVQEFKANSSRYMREHVRQFQWQEGYGAFSVSKSGKDDVIAYIKGQKEHHKNRTFESEFISLLEKHEIAYDEKYVLG